MWLSHVRVISCPNTLHTTQQFVNKKLPRGRSAMTAPRYGTACHGGRGTAHGGRGRVRPVWLWGWGVWGKVSSLRVDSELRRQSREQSRVSISRLPHACRRHDARRTWDDTLYTREGDPPTLPHRHMWHTATHGRWRSFVGSSLRSCTGAQAPSAAPRPRVVYEGRHHRGVLRPNNTTAAMAAASSSRKASEGGPGRRR